jgi:hypothetical protein
MKLGVSSEDLQDFIPMILFHPTRLDEGKFKTRGEMDLRKVICEKTNLVPGVHPS